MVTALVAGGVAVARAAVDLDSIPTPTACAEAPEALLSFAFNVEPAQPTVGDEVALHFEVTNSSGGLAGLPAYTLHGATPLLSGDMTPMTTGQSSLGSETVTYRLEAVQVGTAAITLSVNYETAHGCRDQPVFHFTTSTSPPFTVEIGPAPTPTPTIFAPCKPGDVTVVPSMGAPGTRIVVSGKCYYIHSGASGDIAFDDVRLGTVRGDTGGNYEGYFTVPLNAAPGPHRVGLVTFAGLQSATFVVDDTLSPCIGDCNNDGVVTVDELIKGVTIALGIAGIDECRSIDANGDGDVTIDELVRAVGEALEGCSAVAARPDRAGDLKIT